MSTRCGEGSRTASELIRTIRPWSLCEQVRQRQLDEPHDRKQQQVDRLLDLLRVDLDGLRAGRAAAVRDEDVDPAAGLDRRVDGAREVVRLADVADDRDAADALGLALEHVARGART